MHAGQYLSLLWVRLGTQFSVNTVHPGLQWDKANVLEWAAHMASPRWHQNFLWLHVTRKCCRILQWWVVLFYRNSCYLFSFVLFSSPSFRSGWNTMKDMKLKLMWECIEKEMTKWKSLCLLILKSQHTMFSM